MAKLTLITRGDDAGSSVTANRAVGEACAEGILRNVSVMVPCDALGNAADRLKDLGHVCFGLHATFNAEWSRVRWGSVCNDVPSLLQTDGTFFQSVPALQENQPQLNEAMAELQSQLNKGRAAGFTFAYADQHMGFGRAIDGFDEAFDHWCSKEGLLNYRHYHRRLPSATSEEGDSVERVIAQLKAAESGQWAIVGHPAYDTEEMRETGNANMSGEEIAQDREWQRRWFTDARILDYCETNDVVPIRYDEAERIH